MSRMHSAWQIAVLASASALAVAVSAEAPVPAAVIDLPEKRGLATEYKFEKDRLVNADLQSREVMATIYEINQRMKNMSRKRDGLNNRMIDVQGNVKSVARSIAELELRIAKQRQRLLERLKALYMLGDEGVARVVFSSASSQDLDQSLKYLKLISDNDYRMIKSFEKNRNDLAGRRDRLKSEVKSMMVLRGKLKQQEDTLNQDQHKKSEILHNLTSVKEHVLNKLEKIRSKANEDSLDEMLNVSFYEHKGRLQEPVRGELLNDYSMVENEEFGYRLSHKGHRYQTLTDNQVHTVFNGTVMFIGHINGYGETIIVDHGDHYYTVYASTNQVLVREGQHVKANQVVAKADASLYFEIRHFSDAIDPKPWFRRIQ